MIGLVIIFLAEKLSWQDLCISSKRKEIEQLMRQI